MPIQKEQSTKAGTKKYQTRSSGPVGKLKKMRSLTVVEKKTIIIAVMVIVKVRVKIWTCMNIAK